MFEGGRDHRKGGDGLMVKAAKYCPEQQESLPLLEKDAVHDISRMAADMQPENEKLHKLETVAIGLKRDCALTAATKVNEGCEN